jgi:hypothetical protein
MYPTANALIGSIAPKARQREVPAPPMRAAPHAPFASYAPGDAAAGLPWLSNAVAAATDDDYRRSDHAAPDAAPAKA